MFARVMYLFKLISDMIIREVLGVVKVNEL